MATTVVSSQITAHGYTLASYLTYEVTTNNATTYTISVKGGIRIYTGRLHMSSSTATSAVSGTGQTTASATESVYNPTASTYDQEYVSTSYSWTKGAAANKTISNKISFSSSSYFSGQTATASATITVPAKTYTVSYNANGGSGAPASQTKTHGVTLTLSSTKPARTGYTFKGWATSSTSTTVAYAAGASYTGNANLSLYAVWQINTWAVTYNANGGSGSIANQTKTYNQALTLSNGAGFTRSLYNLVGWATSSGGAKAYNLGGSYTGNAALSLYAVWELAYVKPIISNFICYRVATSSSTTETDDGEYIYISFDFTGGEVGGSAVNPTVVITIGGTTVYNTAQSSSTGTITQWFGTYSKDNAYAVSVKVYDSNYTTGVSKTVTVPTAIYLIDAVGSETNVYAGVMHPAVNGQKLTLPDTNIDGDLMIPKGQNCQWVQSRDYAPVKQPDTPSSTGMYPVMTMKTPLGNWVISTYDERLYFAYITDADYGTGTNQTTAEFQLSHLGRFIAPQFWSKGNDSKIGAVVSSGEGTGISLASGTSWVTLTNSNSLTLTKGSWVVNGTINYSSNASGYRGLRFVHGSTPYTYGSIWSPPVSGGATRLTSTIMFDFTGTATLYLQGVQNSGSTLTATTYLRAIRIA